MEINLDKDSKDWTSWPAEIKGVMSVGATGPINQTNFDNIAFYSNYGEKAVDIMAPGGGNGVLQDRIISPCSQFSTRVTTCGRGNNWYLWLTGTSMASPHVAGAAAVVASEQTKSKKSTKSGKSTKKIAKCIKKGADKVGDQSIYSSGRLNVLGAVACKRIKNEKSKKSS